MYFILVSEPVEWGTLVQGESSHMSERTDLISGPWKKCVFFESRMGLRPQDWCKEEEHNGWRGAEV